jgi:AhpD family alkylhydroperoxidase
MRYVSAVPTRTAKGLTRDVYNMIREDFFKNGSLTSRSKVPELMAAIWTGGREAMLVEDKVDRTTKDAISAVLSQLNDCPYCEDMLISLVHAAGDHSVAGDIFSQSTFDSSDNIMKERLAWVRAIATSDLDGIARTPFTDEQLPEVIGTMMGMSDINRFSHVVMEDSPVPAPFGLQRIKAWALKIFGNELESTRKLSLEPGRALSLLPKAELPADLQWAKSNPRVADAIARWTATAEQEGAKVISPKVRRQVIHSLNKWNGEMMPLDSSWIEQDIAGLEGQDKAIARLAIVVGKASYRVTNDMVNDVLGNDKDEERFIRILAWSSFSAARRFSQIVVQKIQTGRHLVPMADVA